jgi:L-lactate dehydrogenase complex protein LldE
MVKVFYEDIFKNSLELLNKVRFISENTFEFSEFLVKVLKTVDVGAEYKGVITYHDSCHLLRELKIKDGPRELIKSVKGVEFKEMELHDACCGFGGTFSIKFPNVSVSMLDEKIECILNSGADTLVSSDMGCLMNIGGVLSRRNIPIKVMHLAELLASRG